MLTTKKRALVLENTPELQEFWRKSLEDRMVDIRPASSITEFVTLCSRYGNAFDAIVIGNSKYGDGDIEQAIASLRKRDFTNPILCCTADRAALRRQLEAGGPNTCAAAKATVPEAIIGVLGLSRRTAPAAA